MDDPTLEEICASPPTPVKNLKPSSEAPSLDVTQLQEEANKALGHLLATRSSINTCQRKQVSDFGMALHQNESEMTEAIKEAKALCAHTIQDVETCWTVLISKAKVWHATCIKEIEDNCAHALAEAGNCCLTAIREAESQDTSKACSIQQSHAKYIQHLEVEAIEEEGRDHLAFLTTCGIALRASPPKAYGIMVTPFHLLLGNAPTSTLLNIPAGVSSPEQEPALQTPPSSAPAVTGPSPRSKWWQNSSDWVEPLSPSETTSKVTPEEPPHSRWKEKTFFHKTMSRSHQEAFSRDSRLVQKAREDYYQENHLHFKSKTTYNMADVFLSMIESAGLLCSKIYKIQETWTGWHELQYTNYALKALPKG